jgi:hypothetical protein
MSDDKKPKKDLRARLGKTIAPTTPGAPPIAVPGAPPVAPPGAVAGGDVAPPPAVVAPPAAVAPPIVAPPIVAPPVAAPAALFGADVAPPPFAKPAPAPEPPKPRPPADPFAAGPQSAGPQEVRLVFDDKPVHDEEVGRQQRGRFFLVAGVCLIVGAALGAGGGSMNARRALYNVTVRDGHDIFTAVDTASRTVLDAQQKIDALVAAAAGQGGQPPRVDYASIEQLRALEIPLRAGAFARKNYGAFQPQTVDDLFSYYNNIQQIWAQITHLVSTTLPEARRSELDRTASATAPSSPEAPSSLDECRAALRHSELDRTASATADLASAQFGAVLVTVSEDQGGGIMGQLAFIEPASTEGRVIARGTRGGPGREMQVFAPGVTIGSSPTHVLLIDGAGSRGVLATQTGAFGQYVNDIRELKQLMDQTIEIQGRLTTALGEIARLEEVFAL